MQSFIETNRQNNSHKISILNGGGKSMIPDPVFRKAAPLPFRGQKRFFAAQFAGTVARYPADSVFVDLFGGSGLLSHIARRVRPEASVIYNDFDGFAERLQAIPQTNELLELIRPVVVRTPGNKRLPPVDKRRILDIVADRLEVWGYVDFVTLSQSLLFSGNWAKDIAELGSQSFYNTIRKEPYAPAGDYLEGISRVSCDYRELLDRYAGHPGVVFIVDPPYLSTECGSYANYWRLSDYLDVLEVLCNRDFIFFTSEKSQLVELLDWMARHDFNGNPFARCRRAERRNHLNHSSSFTDIMLSTR